MDPRALAEALGEIRPLPVHSVIGETHLLGSRIRPVARKGLHVARRLRSAAGLRLGQVSSSRPLSRSSGYDRGTPIDRYYIERFLAAHKNDVRGSVLEVGGDDYSCKFAGGPISHQDVLNIDAGDPKTTIVGDLADADLLPAKSYDCMIVTQTLQYVFDVPAALKNMRSALSPGGVLLLTVPAVAPISRDQWAANFYWRFTVPSVQRLLTSAFGPGEFEVFPFGNLYAASLFLHGAAVEEANNKKLQDTMPEYAVVICARAVV